ncbi:DUF1604-domain-containing protein [Myriangium duriaei CBS 260.36]|uniref:DUF1604-domain-containing protein n=1 Tax=Myriangium duriaei CBS 260.36 TaxID=1168546 RepID=A0A9P4J6S6_9PEZI|nr:DUF1604-domain-containing protein [Myriangium duriaei CBS 260.36]
MSYKRSRASFEADRAGSQRQPPFAFYGTPLPPLDSDTRDDGTYVPIWKQEVRDERGRKRLHGAFTGGFSAGYFNTVGSKEGWTPSTFVSSRSDRKKDGTTTTQQRPEDFMDDEDIADMQESQKLQTQSDFAGFGSTAEHGARQGLMFDIFRPTGDTMGVKLLQRMGWKPGQGLGPKIRRTMRGDEGASDDGGKHLFAPDDVLMVTFDKKTDKYGIGWAGEQRLDVSAESKTKTSSGVDDDNSDDNSDESALRARKSGKKSGKAKKTGFGVGILNDTGSDDEDPYEMGPKISYNRIIGGDKKKRKGGITANTSSQTVSKPVFLSQRLLNKQSKTGFRRCHDGRLPLDGFILAAQSLTLDEGEKYTPPPVPEGWKPSRLSSSDAGITKPTYRSTADAARNSALDPAQRASLLGEKPLPGKSIFDFISPAVRDRLAAATNTSLPQGKGETAPPGFEPSPAALQKSMWDLVPRIDRLTAEAALTRAAQGWMPYAEDPAKRERYRAFLETTTGARSEIPIRAPSASNDDWQKEMGEFAQAAQVFRPVSGLMASRFTSAKYEGPKEASDMPDRKEKESRDENAEKEDPAVQAARLGMFGPLTRSIAEFFPTRLACKRFGVKAPAHVLHQPDEKAGPDVVGDKVIEEMVAQAAAAAGSARESSDDKEPVHLPQAVAQPAVVDVERNDALEGERAGDDLFRAVFGSDDEDD